MPDMTDWQMRRIESPTENPCCALVREVGEYKATVYFVPETQTWCVDVMHGERVLHRREGRSLFGAIGFAEGILDNCD